jgi:hypothetical protein
MMLVDRAAPCEDRTGQAGEDGARVDRPARNGIGDRELGLAVAPPAVATMLDLPAAVETERAVGVRVPEDAGEAVEAVVGAGQEPHGRAFERDRARMAARSGADPLGLEDGHVHAPPHELVGGREPGESGADDRDVDSRRQRRHRDRDVDVPRRATPRLAHAFTLTDAPDRR